MRLAMTLRMGGSTSHSTDVGGIHYVSSYRLVISQRCYHLKDLAGKKALLTYF